MARVIPELTRCEACGASYDPTLIINRGDLAVCAYCELRVSMRVIREAGLGLFELRLNVARTFREVVGLDMDDESFRRLVPRTEAAST